MNNVDVKYVVRQHSFLKLMFSGPRANVNTWINLYADNVVLA